ncbi:MAG: 3-methyl-2-oxobutanoate hydroxymethyltransferase [Hyphomicrobiales bacterium]|nr:3-methyl-2-oxobutanoate hydroxymethyltransferase [Hyphomicrobiales bacterium]
MQSESARVTTAHEASYRIQSPNSKQRAAKIIALDRPSAELVDEIAREPWNGARFFTSLSFGPEAGPASGGEGMKAWLKDLAGGALDLVSEVASADFIVVVSTAGEDARAVSLIADACNLHHKSLVALVVPRPGASDADVSASMAHLRPFARMLVIASGADYITAMLTALRA